MTPLRAKYIRDLVIRGRSKHTQEAYIRCVCDLARYYRRSPELISYEEVTDWLYHLITERLLSASSVNVAVNAVRFLYAVTFGRETVDLTASVPHMKRATRRAEVYARSEVGAALLRQPTLSALPGHQKLAMVRQADTESFTDHLLPLRFHSAGGTQFSDATQPAQTFPALVRLRCAESAGVWGATDSTAIWESAPSYTLGDKSSISIPIFTALLPAEH